MSQRKVDSGSEVSIFARETVEARTFGQKRREFGSKADAISAGDGEVAGSVEPDGKQRNNGDSQQAVIERIDRFVQSVCHIDPNLVRATELEQECEPGSMFEFISSRVCTNYLALNYYEQKMKFCRLSNQVDSTSISDFKLRERIKHFVASKADLIFNTKGKEKLRSGIDYNVSRSLEAYSLHATCAPPLEFGMQVSSCARRAQIFQLLNIGDIVRGEVVGKRPFGVFVRISSLVHGRNLDFNEVDVQALCHKSELTDNHKSREHFDPIDDFEVKDIVQEEERIAISFRPSRLPSEYGNIELGILEDADEQNDRPQVFDEDRHYNNCLEQDPGFSNPTNVQTLIDILGIDTKPPNSFLRTCQQWSLDAKENAASLRRQQSIKWSMDTTASGVESFKSGDHDKAMKYFNHALQIYDENAEALVARGALYANQNKLEYAIKDFRQALKLNPKHHNACKYLKETLFEKAVRIVKIGNTREAVEIFQEILELDPGHTQSQDHVRELQAAIIAAQCVDAPSKAPKASTGSAKESGHFEHVRELIKSDPDLLKRGRKKKRKKKKKRKETKRKKRAHQRSVLSESTCTASEEENSDGEVWVEKRSELESTRSGGKNVGLVSDGGDEKTFHSERNGSRDRSITRAPGFEDLRTSEKISENTLGSRSSKSSFTYSRDRKNRSSERSRSSSSGRRSSREGSSDERNRSSSERSSNGRSRSSRSERKRSRERRRKSSGRGRSSSERSSGERRRSRCRRRKRRSSERFRRNSSETRSSSRSSSRERNIRGRRRSRSNSGRRNRRGKSRSESSSSKSSRGKSYGRNRSGGRCRSRNFGRRRRSGSSCVRSGRSGGNYGRRGRSRSISGKRGRSRSSGGRRGGRRDSSGRCSRSRSTSATRRGNTNMHAISGKAGSSGRRQDEMRKYSSTRSYSSSSSSCSNDRRRKISGRSRDRNNSYRRKARSRS